MNRSRIDFRKNDWLSHVYLSLILFVAITLVCCNKQPVDYSGPISNWPSYGGSTGGDRYSPLTQVSRDNVSGLKKAWEYRHGDIGNNREITNSESAFEATPIILDSILYFPTPFNRIIALHAETGDEIWTYDPEIDLKGYYANQLICRGVEYWSDSEKSQGACASRIFMGTNDGRLVAVDALTGKPCIDFGNAGQIDLKGDVGDEKWLGEYQVTSPPAIANDVVVVGSAVSDNGRVDAPSGVVRGFDARSGALIWSWDLSPPDSINRNDMLSSGGYLLGSPNVWAPMAVDENLELVYVPTGNPSPDYYGGIRNGIDHYGSSIVALHSKTGEVKWRFQTVHHDLWDFDVPAQPTLTEIEKDGKKVPAVIQATKMGLFFILNRATGEPIFPIEERPVPQTDVPGEYTSPTQPYPVKPLPLIGHDVSVEDAWGPLGMDGECRKKLEELYFAGAYTPPKLGQPTLMYPGNAGGSNWGGIAVDHERQILVANVMDMAWIVELFPAKDYQRVREENPGIEVGPQTGTPYGMTRTMLVSSLGLPCIKPPWGKLAAIDLKTGDLMWEIPFGTIRDLSPIPLKIKYGVPNLGGPIITKSGLIIIAATMDEYIRAFDIDSGKMVWEERLPAGGQATPMTYRVKEDGKQYVVICAGGHARAGTKLGDYVIAYALPD